MKYIKTYDEFVNESFSKAYEEELIKELIAGLKKIDSKIKLSVNNRLKYHSTEIDVPEKDYDSKNYTPEIKKLLAELGIREVTTEQ